MIKSEILTTDNSQLTTHRIPVIAIFDIGKTNKKIFLLDEQYAIQWESSVKFDEILDEDGFLCDDIQVLTTNIFIDKQHLDHLFERFYQIDSSRHSKAKTGGLGLSIVKSIMLLHSGEASAYNNDKGIVFSLKFKY